MMSLCSSPCSLHTEGILDHNKARPRFPSFFFSPHLSLSFPLPVALLFYSHCLFQQVPFGLLALPVAIFSSQRYISYKAMRLCEGVE